MSIRSAISSSRGVTHETSPSVDQARRRCTGFRVRQINYSLIERTFVAPRSRRALTAAGRAPAGVVVSPFLVNDAHQFHPRVVGRVGPHAPALPHCARQPRSVRRSPVGAPALSFRRARNGPQRARRPRCRLPTGDRRRSPAEPADRNPGGSGRCEVPCTAP